MADAGWPDFESDLIAYRHAAIPASRGRRGLVRLLTQLLKFPAGNLQAKPPEILQLLTKLNHERTLHFFKPTKYKAPHEKT